MQQSNRQRSQAFQMEAPLNSFDESKQPVLKNTALSQWYIISCKFCGGDINVHEAEYKNGFVCPDCGNLN